MLCSCTNSQVRNNLSTTEYNAIKINNINWRQINNTKANIAQMKTLFGNNITIKTATEPSLMISFWEKKLGFYFRFEENNPNLSNDYILYYFRILNLKSNITIKGKTITIGSNISDLGNVLINTNDFNIVYGTENTDDILMVKFNPTTNLITNIEYTLFN